ncbi:RidA family protein [Flavobacteriaceae bacterium TP-CH-4]|uniref:RidA family protein n=1 Tax=Pelagihabitans pacificus TaxID=2696054 RepID=A0A967E4Q0_9FLAO|nr:RidA family protein [Pelagihabitans pacificus]NHF58622.1 RidA family protein [Pelagihabitans pacificus]
MNSKPSERIKELGLVLPPAPPPAGLYKPVLVVDNFLYVSGQGPMRNDGTLYTGRVGDDLGLEQGKEAARQVALTMLATITTHFGDVDRIKRLVKTLGMVNCTPNFGDQPLVINGYSELMSDVFGPDDGVGVRSAVGMMLPSQVAVEIEAMFELHT